MEKSKVLVIDDEEKLTKAYFKMIKNINPEIDVYEENIPLDTHTLLNTEGFDLIMLDYKMPKYDGEKIVNFLKLTCKNPTTPVVVISAFLDGDTIEMFEKLGVKKCLPKPATTSDIKEVLESYLKK